MHKFNDSQLAFQILATKIYLEDLLKEADRREHVRD